MVKRLPWYQDKARLTAAVAQHGSVQAAAKAFGTPRATVAHWARIHGVRSGHPKTPGAIEYRERQDATGHTYIVGGVGQALIKIGRTTGEPRSRMQTMQTGSPVPLLLLATLPHPRWEDVLHQHYAARRRQGEWFSLPLEELAAVMRWACHGAGMRSDWPSDEDALLAGWDATSSAVEGVYGAKAVRAWLR
jgi:hypothetical protein